MATQAVFKGAPIRTQLDVCLGKAEKPLGRLIFVKDGQREFSQFAYSDVWLTDAQFFDVSPDLNRQSGYLQGKGTSLGGMRPKCTILDADGALSLGKFPSVGDERVVTRGEVLALRLAVVASAGVQPLDHKCGRSPAEHRFPVQRKQPVATVTGL